MARGIQIPFTLDVREWRRGIRLVEVDLEQVADNLRGLEQAGDQAEKALEDNFRDIGRAAERAGQDVSDGVGRGAKGRIGSIGAEVADEFTENFGEAVRSGNPADALLETFTSLGPALGVLGIGAAVVTGVIAGIQQKQAEARQAIVDNVSGWFEGALTTAAETGQSLASALINPSLTLAQKLSTVQEYYGAATLIEGLTKAGSEAEALGLDILDIANAIGSTGAEQQQANEKIQAAKSRADELYAAYERQTNPLAQAQQFLDGTELRLNSNKNAADRLAAASALNRDTMAQAAGYAAQLDANLARASGRRITIPVGIDAAAFRQSVYAATAGLPSYVREALAE